MRKPGDEVIVNGLLYEISIVEPTAPSGKIYYCIDAWGNGIWASEKEIFNYE